MECVGIRKDPHGTGELLLNFFSGSKGRDRTIKSASGQEAAHFVQCALGAAGNALQAVDEKEHSMALSRF
jgi:hypothetical protein